MKKMMQFVMPVKSLAAMVFAGLMCAYMAAGSLYAVITGTPFKYNIPFAFVLEGLMLSIVIAILWIVLLSDTFIKRMRFSPRLILFAVGLAAALGLCFLVFFARHTDWAKLWLIVIGVFVFAVIALSVLAELYFKATGRRYTELLKDYQTKIGD